MVTSFLGLGTNIGDRKANLSKAMKSIAELEVDIISVSRVYKSEPWGYKSENDFYNQVIEINTGIDAFDLLDRAQLTEKKLGRKKTIKPYSDRIIDIDILFYGNSIISSKPLIIPHPLLHKRRFVLEPMAEIAPGFLHPVFGKTITELLQECDDQTVIPL